MKKIRKLSAILIAFIIAFSAVLPAFASRDCFMPYEDSRFFNKGDYSIHYRIIPAQGKQRGRILMLHGFMCSTYSWRNMAAEMSAQG